MEIEFGQALSIATSFAVAIGGIVTIRNKVKELEGVEKERKIEIKMLMDEQRVLHDALLLARGADGAVNTRLTILEVSLTELKTAQKVHEQRMEVLLTNSLESFKEALTPLTKQVHRLHELYHYLNKNKISSDQLPAVRISSIPSEPPDRE